MSGGPLLFVPTPNERESPMLYDVAFKHPTRGWMCVGGAATRDAARTIARRNLKRYEHLAILEEVPHAPRRVVELHVRRRSIWRWLRDLRLRVTAHGANSSIQRREHLD